MENIMLQDARKEQIKIVDFGLSNVYTGDNPLITHCGSPEYAAPELFVVGKKYGPEVDLWSLGVVLYGMATGRLPFVSPRDSQTSSEERRRRLLAQINRGLTTLQRKGIAAMSSEYRNLVNRLLMPAAHKRITIQELCFHPWITNRQKSMIKVTSDSDLDTLQHSTIVNEIAEATHMDRTAIETDINHEKYGEIGGMYNIKAHEMRQGGSAHAFQARSWSLSQSRPSYGHMNANTPLRTLSRPVTRNQPRYSPARTPVNATQPAVPTSIQRRLVFHRTVAKSPSSGGVCRAGTWAPRELRDSSSYNPQRSPCPVHLMPQATTSHQRNKWEHSERMHVITRSTNKSVGNFTERPVTQPPLRHTPRPTPASPTTMPGYPRHRPPHPTPGIILRDPVEQWIDIQREIKSRDKRESVRLQRQTAPGFQAAQGDRVNRLAIPTMVRTTQSHQGGTMGQGDRVSEQRFYRSASNRPEVQKARVVLSNGTRFVDRSNPGSRPVTATEGKISLYESSSPSQYQHSTGPSRGLPKPSNKMEHLVRSNVSANGEKTKPNAISGHPSRRNHLPRCTMESHA